MCVCVRVCVRACVCVCVHVWVCVEVGGIQSFRTVGLVVVYQELIVLQQDELLTGFQESYG